MSLIAGRRHDGVIKLLDEGIPSEDPLYGVGSSLLPAFLKTDKGIIHFLLLRSSVRVGTITLAQPIRLVRDQICAKRAVGA